MTTFNIIPSSFRWVYAVRDRAFWPPVFLALFYSFLTLIMLGSDPKPDHILFLGLTVLWGKQFPIFRYYLLLFSLFAALYFPAAFFYGKLSFNVVAATLETSSDESREFIAGLPSWLLLTSLTYFIFSYLFLQRSFPNIVFSKKSSSFFYWHSP